MQSEKKTLRREIRVRIAALSPTDRERAAEAVARSVVELARTRDARMIAAYLATDGELSLDPCIAALLADGRAIACPVVHWASREMHFEQLHDLHNARVGEKNIREPTSGEVVPIGDIDLLLVPGVAFDRSGHRLGRGGGFYDRLLADPALRAMRCGVGFECQLFERVPTEQHDQLVQVVVTAGGMYSLDSA
ncbi:MAG: 5-formyltetrahydrofolate cyclo-ligase [Phycisphaerae bacterium]